MPDIEMGSDTLEFGLDEDEARRLLNSLADALGERIESPDHPMSEPPPVRGAYLVHLPGEPRWREWAWHPEHGWSMEMMPQGAVWRELPALPRDGA